MSQQMPTFKSSGAIAAIFGIKNNSQNILPFVTNNNPIPFDGSESLGGVPFCAPFDALPTPFEIVDGFYSGPVDALANALPISLVMEKVVETDMGFHMSNTLPTPFIMQETTEMEMGLQLPIVSFCDLTPVIRTVPIPGVLCPTCHSAGIESWVIKGKVCSKCGTPCQ